MMDRATLKKELERDEGRRTHVYRDSVGLYTIGVGHLVGNVPRILDLTDDEIDAFLERDIDHAEALARLLVVEPTFWDQEVRPRVMVNMAFNLGNRLVQFKHFLAAVNAATWNTAAQDMLESKWAKQVGQRASRLHDMMLAGDAWDG